MFVALGGSTILMAVRRLRSLPELSLTRVALVGGGVGILFPTIAMAKRLER